MSDKPTYSWIPSKKGTSYLPDEPQYQPMGYDEDELDRELAAKYTPKPVKPSYGFAAAAPGEKKVFGANRPGYPFQTVKKAEIKDWINHMQQKGIKRVVNLLTPGDMEDYYTVDLMDQYRQAFGDENVLNAPVTDFTVPTKETIERVNKFIDASPEKVVVHCSAGLGRTGQVLKNYLMHKYHMKSNKAIETVEKMGRNPREAEFRTSAMASIYKKDSDEQDRVLDFHKKYDAYYSKHPELLKKDMPNLPPPGMMRPSPRPEPVEWETPTGGKIKSRYAPATVKDSSKKPSKFSAFWNKLHPKPSK